MSNTQQEVSNCFDDFGDFDAFSSVNTEWDPGLPSPLLQEQRKRRRQDHVTPNELRQGQNLGSSYNNPSDALDMQSSGPIDGFYNGIIVDPALSIEFPFGNDEVEYNIDAALANCDDIIISSHWDSVQHGSHSSPGISHSLPMSTQLSTDVTSSVSGDDIICYGMLHNVDVKLIGDMESIDGNLKSHQQGQKRLNLRKQEDHVVVCFEDHHSPLGYVRSGPGKTISSLLRYPCVEFEIIVSVSYLRDWIGRIASQAQAMIQVDIHIYGSKALATEVGRGLSRGKLWLQKPRYTRTGTSYYNPHYLHLDSGCARVKPAEVIAQDAGMRVTNQISREERLQKMVEDMYKKIDNTRHLDMVEGGSKVNRKLLRHQQEALGFMLERESGHINNDYRLWETFILEDGTEEYRHKITRAKARSGNRPDERGGGILADEMGMGKSLSILALIMKTMDDAKEWVEQTGTGSTVSRSRSTLLVVPSALLIDNWINEVKTHLNAGVQVLKYHGPGRPDSLEKIIDSDILITTYHTLTAEFQAQSRESLLHQTEWYRLVLDEAHTIRRSTTEFYKACVHIKTNSRWCLTGTPIQNKLADIGALFAFLRIEPFSRPSIFRKWIEDPFNQDDENAIAVRDRLVILLQAICLRRTRDIIDLPTIQQRTRMLTFTDPERQQYEETRKILIRTMRHRVGETEKISRFNLFQVHLQLRLICNHGTFQRPFSWIRDVQDEHEAITSTLGHNVEITCSGCQNPMSILDYSPRGTGSGGQCNHVLCSECIEASRVFSTEFQTHQCFICARGNPASQRSDSSSTGVALLGNGSRCHLEEQDMSYFQQDGHSRKMQALIEDISKDLQTTKSIIFTCWTRTLTLLAQHLDRAGISFLRVDGSCPVIARQKKLDQFAEQIDKHVLIMTTGTGGFGLNLTCANRIFLFELQWNPAIERQAIARAIRLGQENEVLVTRYIIKDTIEEDLRSQQHWKNQIAAIGFEEVEEIDEAILFQ